MMISRVICQKAASGFLFLFYSFTLVDFSNLADKLSEYELHFTEFFQFFQMFI